MQASEQSDSDELLQTLHRMPCTGHLSARRISICKKTPGGRLIARIQANRVNPKVDKQKETVNNTNKNMTKDMYVTLSNTDWTS